MSVTVKMEVRWARGRRGSKTIECGRKPQNADPSPGRPLPMIARRMALAVVIDEMMQRGAFCDYSELAHAAGFDRGVISRLMMLRLLPPRIQEILLFRTPEQGDLSLKRMIGWMRTRSACWSDLEGLLADLEAKGNTGRSRE